MRDVPARDQIEQREGAVWWSDVVSAGGHHEQVLLDPRQVDAFVAQPQATCDASLFSLYIHVIHSRYAREGNGGLSATHFAIA